MFDELLRIQATEAKTCPSITGSEDVKSDSEACVVTSSSLASLRADKHLESQKNLTFDQLPTALERRLDLIWPSIPVGLEKAPLIVLWETTRAALHCEVDLKDLKIAYDDKWIDQNTFWEFLQSHDAFRGKLLPQESDPSAWSVGHQESFRSGNSAVLLKASVSIEEKATPTFKLRLRPLQLSKSCRLHRRFGSDRFLEITLPTIDSWNSLSSPNAREVTAHWLTQKLHPMVGRKWTAFWIGPPQSSQSLDSPAPGSKPLVQQKIHFFAEEGIGLSSSQLQDSLSSNEAPSSKVSCRREAMLNWHLQFTQNQDQCYLKLFSRIQLGLTKTDPIGELQETQIRNHVDNLMSSTGEVMNDGVGRISKGYMVRIRDTLNIAYTPCVIQGRIGSAKGLWVIDKTSTDEEDWIETYERQRKWNCDWSDNDQRVLEVKTWAVEPRPATLNTQFLPILEDRAVNKALLLETISKRLSDHLRNDLLDLGSALDHPQQLSKWVYENAPRRVDGSYDGSIPFLGGLPEITHDILNFLINGGFNPLKLKFLQDLIFDLQKQKYNTLSTKMNVKLNRSAYVFMIADFERVLGPREVHLCFSSKFIDGPDEFMDLDGMNVLVSRCPAHLPSDIQKVTAVFKRELRHLRDVVVFPTTGDEPLAKILSGGDYDGDKAWVCWDPEIVNNFANSVVPPKPELDRYFARDQRTVGQMIHEYGERDYVASMIEAAFCFSLKKKFLGICTNHKERFCAEGNSVSDEATISLSWLLSELADEAKQGSNLTTEKWYLYLKEVVAKCHRPKPQINSPGFEKGTMCIVDYLKQTLKATIHDGLKTIYDSMTPRKADGTVLAQNYDADLSTYWDTFEDWVFHIFTAQSDEILCLANVRNCLQADLHATAVEWRKVMRPQSNDTSYQRNVQYVYAKWLEISPRPGVQGQLNDRLANLFEQQSCIPVELQQWNLLKASLTFKLFHNNTSPRFVWQIAGRQLQYIKAMRSGGGKPPVLVSAEMLAVLRPDSKYIQRMRAAEESSNSETG
ncbi:RNA dependent RNA polymerase-domain-containing protein [Truncatella angustata]|uniref:RNA-dependent RNA polymerase n=1 Tax=Truncatella angustata TaxID=152316 RepID=A0A9P8UPQ9_9PEZI|nr:RNA dependent RNA polymerase-domain-containing protein [Truncatella angustata]KAH6655978.1 RNA dependent RNA polymerase-domain-containing protein [Truncatella angustata]